MKRTAAIIVSVLMTASMAFAQNFADGEKGPFYKNKKHFRSGNKAEAKVEVVKGPKAKNEKNFRDPEAKETKRKDVPKGPFYKNRKHH